MQRHLAVIKLQKVDKTLDDIHCNEWHCEDVLVIVRQQLM